MATGKSIKQAGPHVRVQVGCIGGMLTITPYPLPLAEFGALQQEVERFRREITVLAAATGAPAPPTPGATAGGGQLTGQPNKRVVSAGTRRKLRAIQTAKWDKVRAERAMAVAAAPTKRPSRARTAPPKVAAAGA
jgi:hypothetical protein